MAIIKIKNPAIDLDAAEIPNLDAAKITSGTFDDARIAASNVSQHATSFDDNKIVNDISTLALRQASDANRSGYNTNSQSVDVFQDSNKITNLTNCVRSTNEYIASVDDATGEIPSSLGTTTLSSNGSGTIADLFDDDHSTYIQSTNNGSALFITTDFSSARVVETAKLISPTGLPFNRNSSNSAVSRHITWQGSNDGSSYADLQTIYSTTASNETLNFNTTNSTSYRYYRMEVRKYDGSSDNFVAELKYFGDYSNSNSATGSFEGTTVTAPSSVSSMGAIITYQDNAGTNALNTDIVLQLSADGGSNYSTATLTAMPDFSSGIKMAKVNDLSVTAGTSLKYKISFANQASGSKEARIRGVSLQY